MKKEGGGKKKKRGTTVSTTLLVLLLCIEAAEIAEQKIRYSNFSPRSFISSLFAILLDSLFLFDFFLVGKTTGGTKLKGKEKKKKK